MTKHRIYSMSFARVYPLYVQKAEKKGRTSAEVDKIIRWLTGYTEPGLEAQVEEEVDLEAFFDQAPALNPSRDLITGVVCGVRVEEIEEPRCGRSATWTSSSTSWRKASRWRRSCEAGSCG